MLQYKKNNPEVLLPNVKHLEKQSQMQNRHGEKAINREWQ